MERAGVGTAWVFLRPEGGTGGRGGGADGFRFTLDGSWGARGSTHHTQNTPSPKTEILRPPIMITVHVVAKENS